jgi:glucosamine-6-phosphate deaminase
MTEGTIYEPSVIRLSSRDELGRTAAGDIAAAIRTGLQHQAGLRILFAAAPSQEATLRALVGEPAIDWTRVAAFHLDEYLGLPPDAPQRFGNWLKSVIFDQVPLGAVHLMEPGQDVHEGMDQYRALLTSAPIDILCLGIGVNGHLAFNDPPADLDTSDVLRVVELDDVSRQQQVDDLCFPRLADVPRQALTVTVPALLSAKRIFCMVPGRAKRDAVRRALRGPVTPDLPASALRTHPDCTIYLDSESAPDEGA